MMANEQKKIGWLTNSKAMDKNVALMNDRTSRWLMNEYRKKLQKLTFFKILFISYFYTHNSFLMYFMLARGNSLFYWKWMNLIDMICSGYVA